ncbi:MAG TPA: hypothetical protein VMV20_04070, partial [Chitinophagaceae bacterium]|nr:hypothetical protein [Chitinophagaceae bacterium]
MPDFLKSSSKSFNRLTLWLVLALSGTLLLDSCSNTKFIPKSRSLLIASKVELKGDVLISDKEVLRENLQDPSIILQQPNYKTARIARLGLYLYNHYDTS